MNAIYSYQTLVSFKLSVYEKSKMINLMVAPSITVTSEFLVSMVGRLAVFGVPLLSSYLEKVGKTKILSCLILLNCFFFLNKFS